MSLREHLDSFPYNCSKGITINGICLSKSIWIHPRCLGVVHVLIDLVFCVVLFLFFAFILCLVLMFPVSLDYPLFIAHSVFSNVYLLKTAVKVIS